MTAATPAQRAPKAVVNWTCEFCPAEFADLGHAERHVRTEHPDLGKAEEVQVPLPHGIALAALECIRQAYEPGTMAHDTAHKAIDDTAAARAANEAIDVNELPVTPAAAALYKLASRWTSEAFRLGRLLDQKHPRALALEDCSAALRAAVNSLRRDGEL